MDVSSTTNLPAQVTSSAFDHIRSSATNITAYLHPSPKDLLLLLPRIILRAGSFAFVTIPEQLDHVLGLRNGGRVIAEATRDGTQNMASAALTSAGLVQEATPGIAEAVAAEAPAGQGNSFSNVFSFQQLRNFGGFFSYITSKWALGCLVVAILLNRTRIYASARRHLSLRWPIRLGLRILPIVLFLVHIHSILQAMHCQTSPRYSAMKYGKPDKRVIVDYSGDGGLLYRLSSTMLFWEAEEDSCLAVSMIQSKENPGHVRGSLSLLWPIFQSICLSQFIETLSCAVQGRPVMTETGMSIFEHSLAFAEAEAMVSNQLGLGTFGVPKASAAQKGNGTHDTSESTMLVTRSFLFERLNTPPEVLLMSLISCLNNLSSQVLGVLGLQARFRLINTGIWGLCFMGSFLWGLANLSLEPGVDAGILRFPTVCLVGFIPHLLILIGISACAFIYGVALVLSVLSPPDGVRPARTWRESFQQAKENLQANIQLSHIHLNMQEDFYTALLRVGFAALTAASEAVYLNEGRRIEVARGTWLEEERMNEIEASRAAVGTAQRQVAQLLDDGSSDSIANGVALLEEHDSSSVNSTRAWRSGYARERSTKALKGGARSSYLRVGADGVGALQRGGRYILAWHYLRGIFWLATGWVAVGLVKLLGKVGVTRRPALLRKVLGSSEVKEKAEQSKRTSDESTLDFWLLSDEGVLSLPQNDEVDVEAETKKRQRIVSDTWGEEEEQRLDSTLYHWWSHGGWWGERDESGDYQTPERDDDTTSVTSMSTDHSEADWESDQDDSGRRTPTQLEPYPSTREPIPVLDLPLDASQLARLLNPQDAEQRQEARILSHHLSSNRIVTRSQYRQLHDLDKAHVLTSTRYRPAGFKPASPNGRLTPFEESELLEHLILSRRTHHNTTTADALHTDGLVSSWRDGAEGLGAGGPQCVVCQSAPRTILVWPCRCLSICEDCRVSLAMNNFGTCVCCRQEVVGFSRLFVP